MIRLAKASETGAWGDEEDAVRAPKTKNVTHYARPVLPDSDGLGVGLDAR